MHEQKTSVSLQISPLQAINTPSLLPGEEYRKLYCEILRNAAETLAHWMRESLTLRNMPTPMVSIVLGTGLSELADRVERVSECSFTNCYLPSPSADGHAGKFILGVLDGRAVLLQSGRLHCYENWSPAVAALLVRAQAVAGIRTFVLTNAAGGLDPSMKVGDLALMTGHSGAQNHSPSMGLYDADIGDTLGQKFYPVNQIYCPHLRARFQEIANHAGIRVHSGVYRFMPGPRYEEENEIAEMLRQRRAALLTDDHKNALITVGMSTAPEAYALAQLRTNPRFEDIRMLGVSNVTNLAAGIGGSVPTSDEVIAAGPIGGEKLIRILEGMFGLLATPGDQS
jgi:purine-nucleoside phosphorylase